MTWGASTKAGRLAVYRVLPYGSDAAKPWRVFCRIGRDYRCGSGRFDSWGGAYEAALAHILEHHSK